jgi:hypothetical protein
MLRDAIFHVDETMVLILLEHGARLDDGEADEIRLWAEERLRESPNYAAMRAKCESVLRLLAMTTAEGGREAR